MFEINKLIDVFSLARELIREVVDEKMKWDALLFFVVGIFGFLLAVIFAAAGDHPTLIFSRVLSDSCLTSDISRQVGGIAAGITVTACAAFLYSWISHYHQDDRRPGWRIARKISAYNAFAAFVGLAWFSTGSNFTLLHQFISGWGVFFILLFLLLSWLRFVQMPWSDPIVSVRRRNNREIPFWSLIMKGVTAVAGTLNSFVMLGFFFSTNDAAFAITQILFWILVCFGMLALIVES